MNITKKTQCDIAVNHMDAVSNITVDGSIHEHDKLGTFIKDGMPVIVCNRLFARSGAVLKNVHVCSDGYLDARDASIDRLRVERGGIALIWGGTVTNIEECCGDVEISDLPGYETPTVTFVKATYGHVFERDINMTIHEGVTYSGGIIDGSIMIHSGGTLTHFEARSAIVTVRSGGCCDNLILLEDAMFRPYGGKVENIQVLSGARVEITHLSDGENQLIEPLESASHITISSGGLVNVRYEEGEPRPDISKLELKDGACVTYIMVDANDDESYEVRYMEDGRLVAYVAADDVDDGFVQATYKDDYEHDDE